MIARAVPERPSGCRHRQRVASGVMKLAPAAFAAATVLFRSRTISRRLDTPGLESGGKT